MYSKRNTTMFEKYLQEIHAAHFADGVLDDDLPEHFDKWVMSLETDQLIAYGNRAMDELKSKLA